MKYIKDQENLNEKRVLLRLDLNVPLKNGAITDQTRIDKILPVINFLIEKRSKILIISHVGRPKGKVIRDLSLKPIQEDMEKKLNEKINLIEENIFEIKKDILNIFNEKILLDISISSTFFPSILITFIFILRFLLFYLLDFYYHF